MQVNGFPMLDELVALDAMDMDGCDGNRLAAVGLPPSERNLRRASGFPASHDLVALRKLILDRYVQVLHGGQ
jgi:hypothetical protein